MIHSTDARPLEFKCKVMLYKGLMCVLCCYASRYFRWLYGKVSNVIVCVYVYIYIYIYIHTYIRELRGSQGMGVASNNWLDRVLLSSLYMLRLCMFRQRACVHR